MNLAETREFWKGIRREISEFLLFVIVIAGLYGVSTWQRDSTDQQGWFTRRSGLTVHTDELTGCQYLVDHGITPRLDIYGRQIGCRVEVYLRKEN